MTTKTIDYVQPQAREWKGPNGTLAFITVNFDDGSEGSIACDIDQTAEFIAALKLLEGSPVDFELEAKDDYKGTKQYKVKGRWPGKPASKGGGYGGGGGGGGMTNKQAALIAAGSALAGLGNGVDGGPSLWAVVSYATGLEDMYFNQTNPAATTDLVAATEPAPAANQESYVIPGGATLPQVSSIRRLCQSLGYDVDTDVLPAEDVNSLQELSRDKAAALIERLNADLETQTATR